jgi:type III secretion protein R
MDFGSLSPALILVTVVSLALAPFVAVMVTSFTKLVVVLSLLRNALGLQQVPPNVVINGLAIILSIHIMYPVMLDSYNAVDQRAASEPMKKFDVRRLLDLAQSGREPLRGFLVKHSSATERAFFLRTVKRLIPPDKSGSSTSASGGSEIGAEDFVVVVPAFTVTELTAAFQIGFLIFLPFLVIDLIVANILLALGMMMLSPTTVSLPFKLMLFVSLDGWSKLVHGLVVTYRSGPCRKKSYTWFVRRSGSSSCFPRLRSSRPRWWDSSLRFCKRLRNFRSRRSPTP